MTNTETPVIDKFNRWKEEGVYPFLPKINEVGNNTIISEETGSMLMFGSCDYLGLSQNEYIKNQSIKAITKFGTNTHGAQVFCGHTDIHFELEKRLAKMFGKKSAIIFPSGMTANIALLSAIANSEDVIINDRLNHVSIFMGSHLSGAQLRSYPHNNIKKLESILKQSMDKRKRIIVVDGLFSADGDFAPLDKICNLASTYNAIVIVDEAHSFGVVGPNGLGVSDEYNVVEKVDFITGTMSKAIGSVGGFLVTNSDLVHDIRHYSPAYTSSRGSVPAVAAASLASLEYLADNGESLRNDLWENAKFLMNELRFEGFNILNTTSPIIPLLIGDDDKTISVSHWLMHHGLYAAPMISPAVPNNQGRLRIGVMSTHTKEECLTLISLLKEARKKYEF